MTADLDWFYLRAYPGTPAAMDPASRVLVPWLQRQAERVGSSRWYFLRYLDMTGHHLRLRLRCRADEADQLHARTDEVLDLLADLGVDASSGTEALVPASLPGPRRGAVKVRSDLYAPELAKYGGAAGVDLAESVFTSSSELYVRFDLGTLPLVHDRAALVVDYLSGVVVHALPDDEERAAFWAAHRTQWGWQALAALGDTAAVTRRAQEVAAGVGCATPRPAALTAAVAEHGARVVAALDRAQERGVAVPRSTLLQHYVHMDLNRWGVHPAEEFVLGIVTAYRRRDAHEHR